MKAAPRGYFGVGIFHAKSEVNIGTLMRSAVCFGADFIFTVGRRYRRQSSDTVGAMSTIPCYVYEDMDDLKDHLPIGCRIVGVELTDGAHEVGRYSHPEQCVYLLGAEDHGLPAKDMAKCHEIVVIPGTAHCLNVSVAGSIVMFDRLNYMRNKPTQTRGDVINWTPSTLQRFRNMAGHPTA